MIFTHINKYSEENNRDSGFTKKKTIDLLKKIECVEI